MFFAGAHPSMRSSYTVYLHVSQAYMWPNRRLGWNCPLSCSATWSLSRGATRFVVLRCQLPVGGNLLKRSGIKARYSPSQSGIIRGGNTCEVLSVSQNVLAMLGKISPGIGEACWLKTSENGHSKFDPGPQLNWFALGRNQKLASLFRCFRSFNVSKAMFIHFD
jgi:hypothetical protein